jgi:hypothetical protein
MRRDRILPTALALLAGASAVLPGTAAAASKEDIEFVAEHLPEVAMDNRYATLPVWSSRLAEPGATQPELTVGYSRIGTGELRLAGPTLGGALHRRLGERWSATAFGFYDRQAFSGSGDERPLRTLAVPGVPLPLPAPATFDSRGGHATHVGAGLAFEREVRGRWLGEHAWLFGVQAEQVQLRGYAFDYRLLGGTATGATGRIDFDGDYTHLTPFAGVEFPRRHGRWTLAPHALLAIPVPRRGIQAHVVGPGFDLSGDTDRAGRGKHFGDPSLALGIGATYEPWGLSVDLGSTLTQATLERVVHTGIDSNGSLAFGWRF